MYQIVTAQAIPKGNYGDWQNVNLKGMRLNDIFQLYHICMVQLHDPDKNITGWLDLYQLPVQLRTSPAIIEEWLAISSPLTLFEDDPSGLKGDHYVRAMFANAFGITTTGINFSFAQNENLLPDQRVDIMLKKDGIEDYDRIVRNALFTTNGLIFRADTLPNGGICLLGAGAAASRYNDNRVGILDFSDIAEIKTYNITDEMIRGGGKDLPLARGFFIDLPENLVGKTVGIVIAGQMHLLNGTLSVVGDSRVRFNTQLLDFPDIYYSTYNALNLSSIPLTVDQNAPDQFVTSQFTTDESIKAFLQLSQSFLFIIESNNIIVENLKIKGTELPGMYISPGQALPDLPLQVGSGFIVEYNVEERDGFWAVSVPHHNYDNWIRHSTSVTDATVIRDQRYGYKRAWRSRAGFLLIKRVV
ncbi:putative virion structural protein [Serratia phage vB_SmaS-Totoro]|nr:putative virion structural protein [Serratia phage vB_SmaS-Totoro]